MVARRREGEERKDVLSEETESAKAEGRCTVRRL
jgi:hypothetical protein